MESISLPNLPERQDDAHKGTFGRLLIIGGSTGMSGSVALSGMSALRSGAGLVYLAVPESALNPVAAIEPAYLTIPLKADPHGRISYDAFATIEGRLSAMDAGAIGPGLGRSDDLDRIVTQLYRTMNLPLVVDADALNVMADHPDLISEHSGPRVLTPHPGEFAKLTKLEISEVQQNRESLALEFAAAHNVILVLKGAGTIVTDGQKVWTNQNGNSGMATGGTGDVLTGIISSLIAQSMPSFEAAQLAVHVHGMAGDLAAEEFTKRGMIATDLVDFLPYALKALEADSE